MIIAAIIFICVALLFFHLQRELRTSTDAEMYEIDYESAAKLEEVANIRQPFVFSGEGLADEVFSYTEINHIVKTTGGVFAVSVKDSRDYNTTEITVPFIASPIRTVASVIETDTQSRYFSESNSEFLEEAGASKIVNKLDTFLRPPMAIQTTHDLIFGSHKTTTPLRYITDHVHYIAVTRGSLNVKLVPPNHSAALHEVCDYENYEFRSHVNIWNVQDVYKTEMNTVRIIDACVDAGNIISIPPYWWFSIQFAGETGENVALTYTYNTISSKLVNAVRIGKFALQALNTTTVSAKRVIVPTPPVELKDEPIIEPLDPKDKEHADPIVTPII